MRAGRIAAWWVAGMALAGSARADDWALTRFRIARPEAPRRVSETALVLREEALLRAHPEDATRLDRLWALAREQPGGEQRMVERWLEHTPRTEREAYALARVLARAGRTERALDVLANHPLMAKCTSRGSLSSLRSLAALWSELGDDAEAETCLRAALVHAPKERDVLRALVEVLRRTARTSEAVELSERLVGLVPHDPDALRSYVVQLRELGRVERAREVLQRAAALHDTTLYPVIIELLASVGERDLQVVLLRRVATSQPQAREPIVALGQAELDSGDREAAITTWQRLIRLAPTRREGLLALSEVLGDHGLVDDALLALEEAMALSTDDGEVKRRYAGLLERAGRVQPAELAWQRVLTASAQPDQQREARAHLVSLWKRMGVVPMRARALRDRLLSQPGDVETRRLLAELLARDPQRAEADMGLVDRLAAASMDDPDVLRALAALHSRRDDFARAYPLLLRLAELTPGVAIDAMERAVTLALTSHHDDEALLLAQRTVALTPDHPASLRLLGRVRRRRNELDEAVAAYKRVVALAPDDWESWLLLASLQRAHDSDGAVSAALHVLAGAENEPLLTRALRELTALPDARVAEQLESTLLHRATREPERALFRRALLAHYERSASARPVAGPIVRALADDELDERLRAIRLLARVREPAVARLLFAQLNPARDASENRALLLALAQLDDPTLAPMLRSRLPQLPTLIRPLALWTAAKLAGPQAAADCVPFLNDLDSGVRAVAAACLVRARVDVLPALHDLMAREQNTGVRAIAVRARSLLGAPELEPQDASNALAAAATLWSQRENRAAIASALLANEPERREVGAHLWHLRGQIPADPAPPVPVQASAYARSLLTGAENRATSASRALDAEDAQLLAHTIVLRFERGLEDGVLALAQLSPDLRPTALVNLGVGADADYRTAFWAAVREVVARVAAHRATGAGMATLMLARAGELENAAILDALSEHADPTVRSQLLDVFAGRAALPSQLRAALKALLRSARDWPTRFRVACMLGPDVGDVAETTEPVAVVRAALLHPAQVRAAHLCLRDLAAN